MLLIQCPYCAVERPELEFRYGGEAHIARPESPSELTDEQWADFLYMRSNPKGVMAERWRHVHGCGRFFNALRDTVSDRFLAVYKAGEPRPAIEVSAPAAPNKETGR
ncbi:sarcosine oxidase subunit delta [Stappia indica]|uniref:sarcosine oxidase subunit delta n=1 Tax=Stappia indica TaxID=538381 RepID=UPI001CD7E917|nr:sarcosine oxidase subunit delta [Stappia indica]MCA1297170.1 sarcosine oxidase subunit delta [Stappia indica]